MEKFLILDQTAGKKIVSATNVVLVEAGSDSPTGTTTLIYYQGGKYVTIRHDAQVDSDMVTYIQDGILAALSTTWTKPGYIMPKSPRTITDIDINA